MGIEFDVARDFRSPLLASLLDAAEMIAADDEETDVGTSMAIGKDSDWRPGRYLKRSMRESRSLVIKGVRVGSESDTTTVSRGLSISETDGGAGVHSPHPTPSHQSASERLRRGMSLESDSNSMSLGHGDDEGVGARLAGSESIRGPAEIPAPIGSQPQARSRRDNAAKKRRFAPTPPMRPYGRAEVGVEAYAGAEAGDLDDDTAQQLVCSARWGWEQEQAQVRGRGKGKGKERGTAGDGGEGMGTDVSHGNGKSKPKLQPKHKPKFKVGTGSGTGTPKSKGKRTRAALEQLPPPRSADLQQRRFPHKIIGLAKDKAMSHLVRWIDGGRVLLLGHRGRVAELLNLKPVSLMTDMRKHGFEKFRMSTSVTFQHAKECDAVEKIGNIVSRDACAFTHPILREDNCGPEILAKIRRVTLRSNRVERLAQEVSIALTVMEEPVRPIVKSRLFVAIWQTMSKEERRIAIKMCKETPMMVGVGLSGTGPMAEAELKPKSDGVSVSVPVSASASVSLPVPADLGSVRLLDGLGRFARLGRAGAGGAGEGEGDAQGEGAISVLDIMAGFPHVQAQIVAQRQIQADGARGLRKGKAVAKASARMAVPTDDDGMELEDEDEAALEDQDEEEEEEMDFVDFDDELEADSVDED